MGEVQGKKKGTGLREIKCAPGVCKVLVTQTPMCYSLYIPQLLALCPGYDVYAHSVFSTLRDPWTVALQVPLSMGFPRQGYWKGLPLSSPRDLPNRGIEPMSLASPALTGRFFTTSST